MITVIVADDHSVVRDGLTQLLQTHADIRVVATAANGREAVRCVRELSPAIALLDISMPEMNGLEALRQIGERSPATRVVILSMHETPEMVFHALEAGARGYMLKDAAIEEVVAAVRAVHAGRHYLSPRIAEIVASQIGREPVADPLAQLSKREREVLQLVVEGCSSARIGDVLHLSPKTVDTYRSRLMEKLDIKDVTGLVKFALRHGLIQL